MSEKEVCGCGHDHDHEEEFELETLFLTLEDDTEMECGILGLFEVEGKDYIALLPLEDDTVLLYQYDDSGEDLELNIIEDDELFEKVSNAFYDLYEQDEEE